MTYTTEIMMPGPALTSVAGLRRVMELVRGIPKEGLQDLYFFEDGAGTAPANFIAGRPAAAIESVASSNNAYAWMGKAVASLAITAEGSGGTDGVFDLAFSGGGGTGGAGKFTVAGGKITAVSLVNGGSAFTAAPAVSVAASAGLTGAVVTATLGVAGGLRLDGAQIVTLPHVDFSQPHTIVSASRITGSVGGTASERIGGLIATKSRSTAAVRGPTLYYRGANNMNVDSELPYYQGRISDGTGGVGVNFNLTSGMNIRALHRMAAMSYNGSSQVRMRAFGPGGSVIAQYDAAANDAQLTTPGVGLPAIVLDNPVLGGITSTYAGGRQVLEFAAVYNRELTSDDYACLALAEASNRGLRGPRG